MSNTLQFCFLSRSRLDLAFLSSDHSRRHWREIWWETIKEILGKVHFKGTARRESQKEFLMIFGTHLERRDGEQALLGLPLCSAEINIIHLSWKYDKSLWLIVFVTWHAYSPLSTGCTFFRVNSVPFARCTSRSSLYTFVDIWLTKWLPCTLIINVALIISPIRLMYSLLYTLTME